MQKRQNVYLEAKVPICTPRGWREYPSEDPQGGGQKCKGFCVTQTLQTTTSLQTSTQGGGTTGAGTAGADGGKCGEDAGANVQSVRVPKHAGPQESNHNLDKLENSEECIRVKKVKEKEKGEKLVEIKPLVKKYLEIMLMELSKNLKP